MLLLIDAGNTRIKWALTEAGAATGNWHASGAVTHAQLATLSGQWRAAAMQQVWISNVAGADLQTQLSLLLAQLNLSTASVHWFASSAQAGGITVRYRQPAQLGCDRLAAAIGARAWWPAQRLLVANCGTATTIDAIEANGDFIGGSIAPGPALMRAALLGNTAQLPAFSQFDLGTAESVAAATPQFQRSASGFMSIVPPMVDSARAFADNTRDAIEAGCHLAQAGAMQAALRIFELKAPQTPVRCVLSGGAAPALLPYLSIDVELVDNLVLIGLQTLSRVYEGLPPC